MFWKNSKKWKKRRLAIIQRNNNSSTRTFGQKLIMFSVVGSREETHGRILTHLLSPAVLFLKIVLQRGGEANIPYPIPYRIVLFEFPYSLTQAFVCPPQSVCSLLASSILYSRVFKNRAAMQKEVFYSIFCKGKTPKPHNKHMENSSKVWQWTYKWLVSLREWIVQRRSSVWRDGELMKLTYSTACIKQRCKKGEFSVFLSYIPSWK